MQNHSIVNLLLFVTRVTSVVTHFPWTSHPRMIFFSVKSSIELFSSRFTAGGSELIKINMNDRRHKTIDMRFAFVLNTQIVRLWRARTFVWDTFCWSILHDLWADTKATRRRMSIQRSENLLYVCMSNGGPLLPNENASTFSIWYRNREQRTRYVKCEWRKWNRNKT